MLQQVNHDHVYSVLSGNAASLDHNYCQVKDTFLIILTTKIRLGSLKKTSRFNPPRAKLIFSVIFKKSSQMQSWADTKVFAFLRLRPPDAKPFCQSSACVPEILLRLASVCMGEWVNTVGRTVRFLVATALNFKIRENSRLHRVICFRVAAFAFVSFVFTSFWGLLCLPPLCLQNAFALDAQKTWKTQKAWTRKTRRRRERRYANAKDMMRTCPPSSAQMYYLKWQCHEIFNLNFGFSKI